MFSFMTGIKTLRKPEQLARASLSLEHQQLVRPDAGAASGMPAPPAGLPLPTETYTFRLSMSDGQKDDYTIVLTRSARKPAQPPKKS